MIRNLKNSVIVLLLVILFGSIGMILNQDVIADVQDLSKTQINKFMRVASLVKHYYVEDVDWDTVMEGAISGMLSKLDPHSVYIEPQKAEENKENFSGQYEGIGIEFDVLEGYITVISPISGSPSERLGLMAGDRIVKIDGKSAIGIERDEVPKKLKGPKGTSVDVTIIREGVQNPFEITIVRDVIPIYTIYAKFMVDDSTGYISINRFAATTTDETKEAIRELRKQGMLRLVLDLRGNPGGYLHEAVKLAGLFIPGHQLIVETRSHNYKVEDRYYSDQWSNGPVVDFPIVVMIDRGSASASEIVAGAIQDYDRGLIIGNTSFGKGLVQREFPLNDGSAVRVTTAKYYTPSGRLIQREYKGKKIQEYYAQLADTTFMSEDSLKNRPKFLTKGGRTVYGGGGIRPDIVVDWEGYSKSPNLMNKILVKRLFFEFATQYVNKHQIKRNSLKEFDDNFTVNQQMLDSFRSFCKEKDIEIEAEDFEKDLPYIKTRIKAEIARHFWEREGFQYIVLHNDNQFFSAIHSFKEAAKIALLNKK